MKWSEHNAYYRPGAILLTLRGILIRVLNKCIIGCFGCCYWGGGGGGKQKTASHAMGMDFFFKATGVFPLELLAHQVSMVCKLAKVAVFIYLTLVECMTIHQSNPLQILLIFQT